MDLRTLVTTSAAAHRLGVVKFASVGPTPRFQAYERWIGAGSHGEMGWLARDMELRSDPRVRMPAARTAAVFALGHHHRRPPDPGGRTGAVARYAWGRDYHNLFGKRLEKVKRDLRAAGVPCWGGVDTAPIVERAWAAEAGLGFAGKNCVQITPGRGSWMFLGVLFLGAEAEPDPPIVKDHCGTCQRCLHSCPTHAFRGPRDLDATRCIAYWTIEARGLAPAPLLPGFGRWVFGCDRCQEVCPHNHAPPDPDEDDLLPRHAWLDLDEVLATPDDALIERFTGTPVRRPGAAGLKRNAAIVLGNLGDPGGADSLERFGLTHPSDVVQDASRWALARLGG